MSDLIIRNARIVGESGISDGDVAVSEGLIEAVGASLPGRAELEIDATGLCLFPGLIDAHVHFNEPGRDYWEGLATGSAALAAGGGTCFLDMPINSDPPVLDARTLENKRRVAEEKSVLDFALFGGICPGHIDRIDEMAEAGAIAFKAFLCDSGINEFPETGATALRAGMERARRWNLPVAVHAEAPHVLGLAARKVHDRGSMRDFLESRPKEAETEGIRMACDAAGETGAALHVVHVSCVEGLAVIVAARKAGVNVTAEVCPHYLLFNEGTLLSVGGLAKCTPPLRGLDDVEALWESVLSGVMDTIASDHSPAPPSMKEDEDFFSVWGGIAGCQHAWPSFLGAVQARSSDGLSHASLLGSANVARRFRIGNKGSIAPGFDADLTLVRFVQCPPVKNADLLYRHQISLYEGYAPRCRIETVIRRGEIVVQDGASVSTATRGAFVRPA